MANRTDTGADRVRGTNPQFLIDKILRNKIYGCRYWKEFCTGLTAESLVDEAIKLEYVGGSYGGNRAPTKFICLILKLLQISPEMEIILEYIKNPDYKYVSALAMFYLRMVGDTKKIFEVLEEYYSDFRKLRYRNEDGSYQITFMDEFADNLIKNEVYCSTILPHIQTRINLEDAGVLAPRVSILEKELEEQLQLEEQEQNNEQNEVDRSKSRDKKKKKKKRNHSDSRSRSRSGSREHNKKKSKKHKKHKKEKKKWREVVSGKHRRDRQRSLSNDKQEQQKQKEAPANSIEAENELRRQLGIPLLPTN